MKNTLLKVLAVADPAVVVYADKKLNLLSEFNKEVQFDIVPWEQYYNTMLDVFAGNAYYDIIMIAGHLWMRDFIEKGYLAPIQFKDEDILPVIAQEMKYKGKTYLSPSFCDGHMIVYRKSIIKNKLGKLFGDVITPEEYIYSAHIIGNTDEMSAVAMKAHQSEIFTDALPFLRMNDNDIFDANSNNLICNNDSIIKGLEYYCNLKKYAIKYTDTYSNHEIAYAIQKKKVAMAVTWSGQLGVVFDENCIDPQDLGFATFNTAWNVTWSFAISSNSTNKEKANELIKYLRSPKVDKIAGEYSGAPVRRKSYVDGMDKFPWYSCQLKMIENAKPLPKVDNLAIKISVLYEEIAKAFAGKKTSAEAMSDAQVKINQISK